ncbi:hypothetical protein OHB01_15120 [Microbispora hainanensis]|jgi:hypothetical protein|uniref:Nucleotide exchange factor GrpE n=1 Tax=Microbispora hainanensis TaxID=568844 RepID=A0ABZ1SIU5_9ACTN|nr:hypothetical protein [Microbispora hainanensis]
MNRWAIGSAVAGFAAGYASGVVYARRSAPEPPPARPEAEAGPWADIDYDELARRSAEEPAAHPSREEELLGICIDMAHRLRDAKPALWERLNEGLAKVGVDVVVPDGEPFDAEAYDAVDRQLTDDPARHMTVAATLFAGYRDRGTWVRRPEVIVYVNEDAAK